MSVFLSEMDWIWGVVRFAHNSRRADWTALNADEGLKAASDWFLKKKLGAQVSHTCLTADAEDEAAQRSKMVC